MKILLAGLCIIAFLGTHAQNGYKVKADIVNPNNYQLYLAYNNGDEMVINTDYKIVNGVAIFEGNVDAPVVASFGVRGNPVSVIMAGRGMIPGPGLNFVLTNETIDIKGNADEIYMSEVTGGKANKEWSVMKAKEDKLVQENWLSTKKAHAAFDLAKDSTILKENNAYRTSNSKKIEKMREEFVKKYPNSFVSMYFLSNMVNQLTLNQLKASYAKLGNGFKDSEYAKRITDKISNMEATAIGNAAVPINKKDINGNPVNLQTLKGKYVLIDFWGSWCGPCRASFPHLKELYAKYKDDGFEILGIAQETGRTLEDSRRMWKKALEEDRLPWIQVLNNEDQEKFDAVKSYGVTAFPTQILLDQEGKIIARYVGESRNLDEKLKEVFKK